MIFLRTHRSVQRYILLSLIFIFTFYIGGTYKISAQQTISEEQQLASLASQISYLRSLLQSITSGISTLLPNTPSALAQSTEPAFFTTHHDKVPNFAQFPTITTAQAGSWSSPSTWSLNRVPTATDIVLISHTVTYDSSTGDVDTIGIKQGGTLRFSTTASTRLKAANLLVQPQGTLEVGTEQNPIPVNLTAEIIIKNKPLDTTNDGVGVYDPFQFGTAILGFDGTIKMYGSIKTPTFVRLAKEPKAGDILLSLETVPSGWRAGDKLILPDTRHLRWNESHANYIPQWEELIIQTISGTTVTLSAPLTYDHRGAYDGDGKLGFLPHVGNLTRNILIRSENPSRTRGQILFTNRAGADIRYVEIREMGRTKNDPLDSTTADGSGTITKIGTNQIGRYALHAHHLFGPTQTPENGYQFTFIGNAVHQGSQPHSFKWGVAVHDSHYGLIKDNVVYNTTGAGITGEDGSESHNVFERNFVVRVDGSGNRGDGRGMSDLAHDGVAFWFRGVNNYIRDNVAANAYGNGADGHYGFKYFPYFLGNVKIPKYKGADTSESGQYTTQDGNAMPILEFARNEVYSSQSGMTYWWIGAFGDTPRATSNSVIKDLRAWHVYNKGVFHYPASRLVIDGFVVRSGQPPSQTACCLTGFYGPDYFAHNVTIRNADIQGMGVGIFVSTNAGNTTQIIENSYLRNYSNVAIYTMWTSAYRADGLLPRTTEIRNVQFAEPVQALSAYPYRTIQTAYNPNPVRTLIEKDEVYVYDYNGVSGENFQVFYKEQAPDLIVPQSILNSDGSPHLEASPVSGLTNQQNWNQYGIAIAGAVAPCPDDTTYPEIYGFVCPTNSGSTPPPSDTTPPTVSVTAPLSGSMVSGTVTFSASASDNVWVTQVEFFVDGVVRGTDTTIPYSINWDTTNGGTHACTGPHTHSLTARARDAALNTTTSSAVTVNMNNPSYCSSPDTTSPSTPQNLSATAVSTSQINLSWSASTDNVGVTGYQIERCIGATCTNFTQIATLTGTTFNNTGLVANTTYRYRVRATDVAGNLSGYSTIVNATTKAPQPLQGDLNNDGTVNTLDWSLMNAVWFTNDATADLNSDGLVNSIDYGLLNRNWGRTL